MRQSGIPPVHCVGAMNTNRRARATQRMIATVRSRARFRSVDDELRFGDVQALQEQGRKRKAIQKQLDKRGRRT